MTRDGAADTEEPGDVLADNMAKALGTGEGPPESVGFILCCLGCRGDLTGVADGRSDGEAVSEGGSLEGRTTAMTLVVPLSAPGSCFDLEPGK